MAIDLRASNEIKQSAMKSIDGLAAVAQQLEMKASEKDLRQQRQQLMEDSFRIMVAGSFRNGKSTLLNALLGLPSIPVAGLPAGHGPMPVKYEPTTAVLTSIAYSEKPFVRKWTIDGKFETWTLERYLREATVKPDEEETEKFFANIRQFEMGFPAEICRQGVMLIDSPGTDDTPPRTAITNAAARTCDAAIVVFRSDILAGASGRDFYEKVLTIDGTHNFIVVNMMHGKESDDDFKRFAWNRLVKLMRGGPAYAGQDFGTQDIYFVNAKIAEEGKLNGDAALVAQSGLEKLERRLSEYLTRERHRQHIEKFIKGAIRLTEPVVEQINRRSSALRTESEALVSAYEDVKQRLEKVDAPSKKVPLIFAKYKKRAIREVAESFEREIMHLERELPARLTDYPLPSGGKILSMIHQKRMMREAYDFCQQEITERITRWSSESNGGAKKVLDPIIEAMMEDVQHEINQIEKAYRSFYLKIGGPEFGAAATDHLSWYERAGWVVAGLLVHDVGLAIGGGALGWRGAAVTIGSYIAAGVAGAVMGLSLVTVLPLALVMAAVSQIFMGKLVLEKNVKEKVLNKVLSGDAKTDPPRPPLSEIPRTASPLIEAALSEQIDQLEQALLGSITTIVAEEQRNLKAIIENSQRGTAEKERMLQNLEAMGGDIARHRKALESAIVEAQQVLA